MSKDEVRSFVVDELTAQLSSQGRVVSEAELQDDSDLLLSGLIDSLGILELTAALEEHCGMELDFETLDPELMTVLGPLCEFVADQTAAAA